MEENRTNKIDKADHTRVTYFKGNRRKKTQQVHIKIQSKLSKPKAI